MSRSTEQIQGTLQGWPDSFFEKFGRLITKGELLAAINERRTELETAYLKNLFADYSVGDLDHVSELLTSETFPNILEEGVKPNTTQISKTKKTGQNA